MDYQAQAAALLNEMGVKFSATYVGRGLHFHDDKQSRCRFRCTFSRNNKQFSVMFGQSIAAGDTAPTAYDLLTCLTKNDPGTFEDFCVEFGYRNAERTAADTPNASETVTAMPKEALIMLMAFTPSVAIASAAYTACCNEWAKVSAFFTDGEIERLQEIQ